MKKLICTLLIFTLLSASLASCQAGYNDNVDNIRETMENTEKASEMSNTKSSESATEQMDFNLKREFRAICKNYICNNYLHCLYPGHMNDIRLAFDNLGQPVLNIELWDENFVIPTAYGDDYIDYAYSAALTSDTSGIFIAAKRGVNAKLEIWRFTKESKEYATTILDIREDVGVLSVFSQFIDENIGYILLDCEYPIISHPAGTNQLLIYKTTDGGKSWNKIEQDEPILINFKECPDYFKFIDQNTGIICKRYYYIDQFEGRTLLTRDGGATWQTPDFKIPYPYYEEGFYSEILSLELVEGVYILNLKVVIDGGGTNHREEIHQYTSIDFVNWELKSIIQTNTLQ